MSVTTSDNNFHVTADSVSCTVKVILTKDGRELGFVEIDTNKASALAGVILASISEMFRVSGRHPTQRKPEITVIRPSGYSVGQGRTPGSHAARFHFGDTILGIELPPDDLQKLGQRLMTVGADEGSKQ